MICPGTGLSPCRAIIQHRYLKLSADRHCHRRDGLLCDDISEENVDECWKTPKDILFLGFRNRNYDFLYGNEWNANRHWLDVHVAFSRDDPTKKTYVQELVVEHGNKIAELLLKHNAAVYVCGRSHPMPSQVQTALKSVLLEHNSSGEEKMSEEQVDSLINKMVRERRYVHDTWG
eukprot:GHVS01054783.1.p1 GENE.GHVS01054783.1~~GHVS01054783.1.p1  ORF type:complete len:175 (+),score=21.92 GHVS01054783.1:2-526(+)